ncbi:hypothetical protein [Rhizobium tubonense]|uniref:Uncharacterized protein n=1 Tax=Rhizobium tubonense TaxID=484088 RepID=A0A2W4E9Q4_9HYPH|nr:hypothetical protein [Rhizobium tubonense]PZM08943.1 hypothetical protein CPY51_27440 [Rhizobium tubonense]
MAGLIVAPAKGLNLVGACKEFLTEMAALIEVTRYARGSAWKFGFLARRGVSYFLHSDHRSPRGYNGQTIDMKTGVCRRPDLTAIAFAAEHFQKNSSMGVYVGAADPIDEIAKRFYAAFPTEAVPEFCQISFDRPTDDQPDNSMREYTNLIFVGFSERPQQGKWGELANMGLDHALPAFSSHWCSRRIYLSG